MKTNREKKPGDHSMVVVPISITRMMRRAAKEHSKKLKGCPRKTEGSISYFFFRAGIDLFKSRGFDIERLDPIYLCETKRVTGRPLSNK